MANLKILRCQTCKALGVGPHAVKLWPLDDLLYCEQGTPAKPGCFRLALHWHENRPRVVAGIQGELAKIAQKPLRFPVKKAKRDWRGYIAELCELAGIALEHDDRRSFIYYAARAVLAWGMKEHHDNQAHAKRP